MLTGSQQAKAPGKCGVKLGRDSAGPGTSNPYHMAGTNTPQTSCCLKDKLLPNTLPSCKWWPGPEAQEDERNA